MTQASNKTCEQCGGTISPQEILDRHAGLVHGKLLCQGCVTKKREELLRAREAAAASESSDRDNAAYIPAIRKDEGDANLTLVDEREVSPTTRITSFAESSTLGGAHHEDNLKRQLCGPNDPATRCRTFHGKLTAAGLAHMDDIINEWLDGQPNVFIKSVTSSVGQFEGKTKEPHLLVTIFY